MTAVRRDRAIRQWIDPPHCRSKADGSAPLNPAVLAPTAASSRADPTRDPTARRVRRSACVGFLRSRGVCAQAIASSTPIEDLAAAFARHLREQQGLASPTIERYTIVARQFLENHFSAGEIDMRAVVAIDSRQKAEVQKGIRKGQSDGEQQVHLLVFSARQVIGG
jgi:hypothetical protein